MYIEFNEWTKEGQILGSVIINTDFFICIDNYNDDTGLYQLVIREREDTSRIFYIKQSGYDIVKEALFSNRELNIM